MDVLNQVLASLQVVDSSLGVFEFEAPWGYEMRPVPSNMVFLFSPQEGTCWLRAADGATAELAAGDVALVQGESLTFSSAPTAGTRPFLESWFDARMPGMGSQVERSAPACFRGPGSPHAGQVTDRLLSVAYLVEDVAQSPVLRALPALCVLRRETVPLAAWVEPLVAFIDAEQHRPQPGYNATARALAQALFIGLIRLQVLHSGAACAGWMRGMSDPHVGRALSLLHGRYAEDWRLPTLAAACGLSRSSLARRFLALVGMSPMAYLTAVRMHEAARRVCMGQSVSVTAERVGYRSEWSFRQAFVRQFGMTPLRYGKSPREPKIGTQG